MKQELIAKGHGTFFRSIGAILGFTPPKGSLKDKRNKYNYKFKKADETNIIQFNSDNLLVNYIITKERDEACEEYLIQKYRPIINIDKIRKSCLLFVKKENFVEKSLTDNKIN